MKWTILARLASILVLLTSNVHALDFSAAERAAILSHGPWPVAVAADTSNRHAADPDALALGRLLFTEPRLSSNGLTSCASCHDPDRHFQDGRATALGQAAGNRNTPSLLDSAGQRWYGWDGASDSLWSASMRALLRVDEMGIGAAGVADLLRRDQALRRAYTAAFGAGVHDDEQTLVKAAKALAAWQSSLISPATPFDNFRDALARNDSTAAARYPEAAQRGLRLFIGEARCNTCHAGPRFSNGEFGDIGRPYFLPGGGVDPGRFGGLRALQQSRFNRLGVYADDAGSGATATRHVSISHRNFGEFKVPSLRGLAHTAPFMHDGSLASLTEVLRYYNELPEERLHADGEKILRALSFDAGQLADLEEFLRSLSR